MALSTFYRSQLPQRFVRGLVEQELTKALRRQVTVGDISGNLLTQARLNDVRIASYGSLAQNGTIFDIDEMVVQYSLFRALRERDFLAGAVLVDVHGVDFRLIRWPIIVEFD